MKYFLRCLTMSKNRKRRTTGFNFLHLSFQVPFTVPDDTVFPAPPAIPGDPVPDGPPPPAGARA